MVNVLQGEKVLAGWPDLGWQSISTKPQACGVADCGIRLQSGCCVSIASGYLNFGWYFIDIPLTCVWLSLLETCKGIHTEGSLLGSWVFICRYPCREWGELKRAQLQLGLDDWHSSSYTSANKIFYLVFLSSSVPWGLFSLFSFQWGLNVFLRFPREKTGKALGSLSQLHWLDKKVLHLERNHPFLICYFWLCGLAPQILVSCACIMLGKAKTHRHQPQALMSSLYSSSLCLQPASSVPVTWRWHLWWHSRTRAESPLSSSVLKTSLACWIVWSIWGSGGSPLLIGPLGSENQRVIFMELMLKARIPKDVPQVKLMAFLCIC